MLIAIDITAESHMMPFTRIAVALFSVIALAHLLRLFTAWQITVGGFDIPRWWSVPGLIIAGGLAVMVWREARGMRPG